MPKSILYAMNGGFEKIKAAVLCISEGLIKYAFFKAAAANRRLPPCLIYTDIYFHFQGRRTRLAV